MARAATSSGSSSSRRSAGVGTTARRCSDSPGERHAAAVAQLVVERRLAEVHVEQGPAESGGEPDPVQGQRSVAREAQPLEVEQRRRGLQAQPGGHHPVGPQLAHPHDAPLGLPGRLDGREQAVQRAHRLVDLGRPGEPRRTPALPRDHAGLAQAAQRLAHRVPADGVLLDQRELAGELLGEVALADPAQQVVLDLLPQRLGQGPVHAPRTPRGRPGGSRDGRNGYLRGHGTSLPPPRRPAADRRRPSCVAHHAVVI